MFQRVHRASCRAQRVRTVLPARTKAHGANEMQFGVQNAQQRFLRPVGCVAARSWGSQLAPGSAYKRL